MSRYIEEYGLVICPDFQRGHVWTEDQQIAYVEYILKNPSSGRTLYLNHPGWMKNWKGEFVLVDGLQRFTASRRFMNNEIPAYGFFCRDFRWYEGDETGERLPSELSFNVCIATLKSRADVLQWYLDFNSAGTQHSAEELARVRGLLRTAITEDWK